MIELLAPVGSKEAFYAAIENRADAIYLGGKQFGARAYANNFSNDELKDMISYAHLFSVKVYVTINTIIFDEEIPELLKFIDFLYNNDCDAIIVQDLGVVNIVRTYYPDFEIHASTQLNVHSVEEAKVLKSLGVRRIVVAREISLEEIKKIKQEVDIEIEAFVHGALCISCSGNCYISSLIGKRSGNRGRCAQPCRLSYKLEKSSNANIVDEGYLISPKDLYTLPYINQLIEANIDSLKIEGRMKRAEYVAQILKSYRAGIDSYYKMQNINYQTEELELRKIFNRDFTSGHLFSTSEESFINKLASNHQGILVGKVIRSNKLQVSIKLYSEVNFGDSIRLVGKKTDAITINQMYINNKLVKVAKKGDVVNLRSHIDGLNDALVFLTTSKVQIDELSKTYLNQTRKVLIDGVVTLDNNHLKLTISHNNNSFTYISSFQVSDAINQPTNDKIADQICKTSNTVFKFKSIEINIDRPIFIQIKDLNEFRRIALEDLKSKISKKHQRAGRVNKHFNIVEIPKSNNDIIVKVRTKDQLDVVLDYRVKNIYITDLKLKKYINNQDINVHYVLPRIYKDDFQYYDENIVSSTLGFFPNYRTSVYKNITNAYAVNLLENLGVKSIGLSIELSIDNIIKLIENYKKLFNRVPNLEMNVYGKYELMMLKYKFNLDKEDNISSFNLVDRKDYKFPLLLENNYVKVLNSKSLHLHEYMDQILSLGITPILDFTNEDANITKEVCNIYLNGENNKLEEVTYGHFKEGVL